MNVLLKKMVVVLVVSGQPGVHLSSNPAGVRTNESTASARKIGSTLEIKEKKANNEKKNYELK